MAAQGSGGGGGCLGIFAVLVVVGLVVQYWYVVLGVAVLAALATVGWGIHAQRQAAEQRREAWAGLERRFDHVLRESGSYMLDSAKAAEAPLWLDPANPEVRSFTQTLKAAEAAKATLSSRRSAQADPAAVGAGDLKTFKEAVEALEQAFERTDARLRDAGWDGLMEG
jgi:predicted lipid-binding transport protein (Tim44 family)